MLRDCVEKVEKLGYRVEMRESVDERLVADLRAKWGGLAVIGTDRRDNVGSDDGRRDAEDGSDAASAGNKRMRLNDDESLTLRHTYICIHCCCCGLTALHTAALSLLPPLHSELLGWGRRILGRLRRSRLW